MFLKILGTITCLKQKNTANYAFGTNWINNIEDLKKNVVLIIPVAIESLLYLTPSQAKGKFLYPLKPWLRSKCQLYSIFF